MSKSISSQNGCQKSVTKEIQVPKAESAYVYFILEAYEGVTSYSTLSHEEGDQTRNLRLSYSPDFESEVRFILKRLEEEARVIVIS